MSRALVLVVEYHPDVRSILRTYLEIEDFAVKTAEDGIVALSLLSKEPPDVLLTDLMLPRLPGTELIRVVRSTPELAKLPIVAMSDYEPLHTEALAAGANAIVTKPFDFEILTQTLTGLIARTDEA